MNGYELYYTDDASPDFGDYLNWTKYPLAVTVADPAARPEALRHVV